MNAVLSNVATPFVGITAPLATMLIIAATALVAIGVAVRRSRARGSLTFAFASTSAAAATLVLATALFASASMSVPAQAAAAPSQAQLPAQPPVHSQTLMETPTDMYLPVPIDGLEGYQLPTE